MIKRYSQFIKESNHTYNIPDTKKVMDYVLPLLDESDKYYLTYLTKNIEYTNPYIDFLTTEVYNLPQNINKTIYGYCFTIEINNLIEISEYIKNILIDNVLPNISDDYSCLLYYRIDEVTVTKNIKPHIKIYIIDRRIKDFAGISKSAIEYKR